MAMGEQYQGQGAGAATGLDDAGDDDRGDWDDDDDDDDDDDLVSWRMPGLHTSVCKRCMHQLNDDVYRGRGV